MFQSCARLRVNTLYTNTPPFPTPLPYDVTHILLRHSRTPSCILITSCAKRKTSSCILVTPGAILHTYYFPRQTDAHTTDQLVVSIDVANKIREEISVDSSSYVLALSFFHAIRVDSVYIALLTDWSRNPLDVR